MSEESNVVVSEVLASAPVEAQAPEVKSEVPVQAEAVEAAPVEEAKPVEQERVSSKLAKQKEREVKLNERERILAEREKAVVERSSFLENLKKKPIQTLKESGLSLADLADLIVKDGGDGIPEDPVETVSKTVAELKAKLEEKEKAEVEARAKAESDRIDAVINGYKAHVVDFVRTNKDKYELTNTLGEQEAVFAVVEEYHDRTGEVLLPEQAAEMVETYLERRVEEVAKTNKVKTKFLTPAKTEQKPSTLSNSLSSYAAPAQAVPAHLSRDERIAAAAKLLRHT